MVSRRPSCAAVNTPATMQNLIGRSFAIIDGCFIRYVFSRLCKIFKKYLHIPPGWILALSVVTNIVLLLAFFWFLGARLKPEHNQDKAKLDQDQDPPKPDQVHDKLKPDQNKK